VAKLDATTRANLPDSAFAYVDSKGRRRLPIYDESHVRNALSRFNQVDFEDDRARERARTKLLQAAKRFRIVPIGFIDGQLRSERELPKPVPALPTGFVTLMMTDIEGSTSLVGRLGEQYGEVLDGVRGVLHEQAANHGHVVEVRADEMFAVFATPAAAVHAAIAIQRAFAERAWLDDVVVRVRIGVHSGYPTRKEANYIGLPVHLASRVCGVAHGGQVVVTGDTRLALTGAMPAGIRLRSLGSHRLRGIPSEVPLYQLAAKGLASKFPPLRGS
jgi:class 3 adenylate cyclase